MSAADERVTRRGTALTAVDFQARQDAIGEKRKGPGEKLTVKVKTRAKPADVPETEI